MVGDPHKIVIFMWVWHILLVLPTLKATGIVGDFCLSTLLIGFALSKGPHLHRAYAIRVCMYLFCNACTC